SRYPFSPSHRTSLLDPSQSPLGHCLATGQWRSGDRVVILYMRLGPSATGTGRAELGMPAYLRPKARFRKNFWHHPKVRILGADNHIMVVRFSKKSKKYFRGTLKFRKTLPLEELGVAEKKHFVPQVPRFFEQKSGWHFHKIRFFMRFPRMNICCGKTRRSIIQAVLVPIPVGTCRVLVDVCKTNAYRLFVVSTV